jgi:hypothetical protein
LVPQNFMTLLLNKYRTEFEQVVYVQAPPLVQLCAKRVAMSVALPSPGGTLTRAEVEALLPQELVAYLRDQPWVVTPKAREERWRRMNDLIVLLGQLYNVRLVEEEQVHAMLGQLCDSIENGMHRNVEPLCKLLVTVGPALEGRSAKRREHLTVDQDVLDEDDYDDDYGEEKAEEGKGEVVRMDDPNFESLWGRGWTNTKRDEQRRTKKREGLGEYMAKVESYRQRVREWKLGERIRFMIQDLLELKARNWKRR